MTDKEKIAKLESDIKNMQNLTVFVAMLWEKADDFIWESAKNGFVDIGQYPSVQGTSVRMSLHKVSNKEFASENAQKALNALLNKQ